MKKICTIVGARPQFIKIASLSKQIRKFFEEIIIHTGQHYDKALSQVFFEDLSIPRPDYNLNIGSSSHAIQTGQMLQKIEEILIIEKPDMVLVFGDTNSTLAGALAASKLHIPLVHVEAGLRSFNKKMPEEINRILTDHCSDLFFTPTVSGVENLKNEGITGNVYNVGDVMYDAILNNIEVAEKKSKTIGNLGLKQNEFLYATVHRPSNTDNLKNLKNIIEAFLAVEFKIIFPLHPRTREKLHKFKLFDKVQSSKNILLINPISYLDSINIIKNAKAVITDSGGIQKEAYILGTPCITLREDTEWVETVNDGWNVLVGADKDKILSYACNFNLNEPQNNYYGDGNASKEISQIIWNYLN